jgi:phosphohistidine phosphatase
MEEALTRRAPRALCFMEKNPMNLLLWRHAEAEDGIPDLQRKLTRRGEQQARQMAQWINLHAPQSLRILASPAVRTQQTARALGRPYETDPRLAPGASVDDLLDAAGWYADCGDAKEESVLIVGHQPTLGQAAAFLLCGYEAGWSVKKGAVWWLSCRTRNDETQTIVQAVISCSLLKEG